MERYLTLVSLSLLTWRLGEIESHEFEKIVENLNSSKHPFEMLDIEYQDTFLLQSCQRYIIVTTTPKAEIRKFYNTWLSQNNLSIYDIPEPEFYFGMNAIYHLAEVVSALDSAVIGEDQIQGQFRDAYNDLRNNLSPFLDGLLQKILRTGKRVRNRSLLEPGQISTISIVIDEIKNEIDDQTSIGILGTGKMANGIIRYLKQNVPHSDIAVYSTTDTRIGDTIENIVIGDFRTMQFHDVLFTATTKSSVVDDEFYKNYVNPKIIIVDLGMPRNCKINQYNPRLYTLEQIIHTSKAREENSVIKSAYAILEDELEQLKIDILKQQHADSIKHLREEMLTQAQQTKEDLVEEGSKAAKTFDQMVNKLIHISQKHLEKHIILEPEQ